MEEKFEEKFINELPIRNDPKLKTMDKKLIITVATTGAWITKDINPNQPITTEEIKEAVVAAYKAGASIWHVHTRDEKGRAGRDPETIKRTIDVVRAECPDIITSVNVSGRKTGSGKEMAEPIIDYLTRAGKKYVDTALVSTHSHVNPFGTPRLVTKSILQEEIKYLEEKNVVPEFNLRTFGQMKNLENWLVQPGVIRKPFITSVVVGYHGSSFIAPGGPDPWGHIYLYTMMHALPARGVLGVSAGGRNWLPLSVSAIMAGVDIIRVGSEDALYMYPHRDDFVTAGEAVRKVQTIAKELGRPIATPAQARRIIGIK